MVVSRMRDLIRQITGTVATIALTAAQFSSILIASPIDPAQTVAPPDPQKPSRPPSPPSTVDPIVNDWQRFIRVRFPDNRTSWTTDKDHEDAGIETDGNGPYLGVTAYHSFYQQGTLNLALPAGATQPQILYAPTTKPANGGCLEMGSAYTTKIGEPTSAFLYVYNFCEAPQRFVRTIPMDAAFTAKYGAKVNGLLMYVVSIFSKSSQPSESMVWYAQIYNFQIHDFEPLWQAQGYFREPNGSHPGWSIFETWYQPGQCSKSLPVFTATNLSYLNGESTLWEKVKDNMNQLQNSIHYGKNCFLDDEHGLASYRILHTAPESWQVNSTGN